MHVDIVCNYTLYCTLYYTNCIIMCYYLIILVVYCTYHIHLHTYMVHTVQVTLDKGGINWDGLQLDQLLPVWLYDCYDAVESVSRAFDLDTILLSPEGNVDFYQQLGKDCLHYFNDRLSASATVSLPRRPLTMITEVNVSNNQLAQVPEELFQMQSLQVLKLSHNELTSLPISDCPYETLYTSPLQRLELDWNKLELLPEGLFRGVANSLEELSAECNQLKGLPPGLWVCPKLKTLKLSRNMLSQLHTLSNPAYFADPSLTKQVYACIKAHHAKNILMF